MVRARTSQPSIFGRLPRTAVAAVLAVVLAAGASACSGDPKPEQNAEVLEGYADFHNHQFAYLGFGGSAISHSIFPEDGCIAQPSGGAQFSVARLVRVILFSVANDQAAAGRCYPSVYNIASQRVDVTNLKRSWQYGQRLMVMMAVNSEFQCKVGGLGACVSDRESIDAQIAAAKALQDRIDNEEGGPGQGWYRIVTSPEEARAVIRDGKLAVVLGIEAASAFGCEIRADGTVTGLEDPIGLTTPTQETTFEYRCDGGLIGETGILSRIDANAPAESVPSQLEQRALALFDHYWDLGVRHFYLVHNFRGIAGGYSLFDQLLHGESLVGDDYPDVDRVIGAVRPFVYRTDCRSLLQDRVRNDAEPDPAKHEYGFDGGKCNAKGLSDTGVQLAKLAAGHGAVLDVDHTSQRTRRELLAKDGVLGGAYPTVSSHAGAIDLFHGGGRNEGNLFDQDIAEIVSSGGALAPRLPAVGDVSEEDTFPAGSTVAPFECGGTSESWVQVYRYYVDRLRNGKLINGKAPFVGVGIGTDMGPPIPTFTAPRFKLPPGHRIITATPVPLPDYPDALVRMFLGPKVGGACYDESDGTHTKVNYPLTNSRLAPPGVSFPKSKVPWDSAEYDINYDGVPHVGMLPDFIEELMVLGLSKEDLDPLWHGAEAYIRTWEASEAWASGFDVEGTRGVRDACEQQRRALLDGLDTGDADAVVAALRGIRNNLCRTVAYTDRGTDGVVTIPVSNYEFGVARPYIVPVGTTVKVVNNDGINHTWTANDGSFDETLSANGGTATHTFNEAGIYDFYCSDHPTMRNTIVVR